MKSLATFSFNGNQVEITSEIVKHWMSKEVEGHLEIDLRNTDQAEAIFDYLCSDDILSAKDVSLLEQMGTRQFASLFTVHNDDEE